MTVQPEGSCTDKNNLDEIRKQYKWSKKRTEEVLSSEFPTSPPEERLRFLISVDGDVAAASERLGKYLKWRKRYDLDNKTISNNGTDEEKWNWASSLAIQTTNKDMPDKEKAKVTVLPRIVANPNPENINLVTTGGNRIAYFYGAKIDLTLASSTTYALALGFYIDAKIDRNSMEKICVLIDTRGGGGWANPSASTLVPFAKEVSALLGDLLPERLAYCFIFPVPYIAKFVWYLIYPFLDAVTAEKMTLFSGSTSRSAPPPIDDPYFTKHIDRKVIDYLEELRNSFIVKEGKK